MRVALESGRANDERWHVRKDGTALWASGALSIARDEAGQLQGFVIADPDRIQQVVWNLLSNAVKFTPSGGRVEVTVSRDEDDILIEVTDTGGGIAPELLPHVFERFLQGEAGANRQHGGLGLGLAISKQLVELHGGEISARSAGAGHGATFQVRLPLKSEPLVSPITRLTHSDSGLDWLRAHPEELLTEILRPVRGTVAD